VLTVISGLNGSTAAEKLEQENNDGRYQQQMDQAANGAGCKAQEPQHQEYDQKCPKHVALLSPGTLAETLSL
jgi:hypothetical protein